MSPRSSSKIPCSRAVIASKTNLVCCLHPYARGIVHDDEDDNVQVVIALCEAGYERGDIEKQVEDEDVTRRNSM
jgi:hypothetical protein